VVVTTLMFGMNQQFVSCINKKYNNVNQPDILFASALKMPGYLRRYANNTNLYFMESTLMKVKDLIKKLNEMDHELDVLCYTEDSNIVPESHIFSLLDIEDISVVEGEKRRGDDGIPSMALGKSDLSKKHVTINITSVF